MPQCAISFLRDFPKFYNQAFMSLIFHSYFIVNPEMTSKRYLRSSGGVNIICRFYRSLLGSENCTDLCPHNLLSIAPHRYYQDKPGQHSTHSRNIGIWPGQDSQSYVLEIHFIIHQGTHSKGNPQDEHPDSIAWHLFKLGLG